MKGSRPAKAMRYGVTSPESWDQQNWTTYTRRLAPQLRLDHGTWVPGVLLGACWGSIFEETVAKPLQILVRLADPCRSLAWTGPEPARYKRRRGSEVSHMAYWVLSRILAWENMVPATANWSAVDAVPCECMLVPPT